MDPFYVPSLSSCIMRMLLFFIYFILFVMPSVISAVKLSDRYHPHLSNVSDQQALLGFMSAITRYDPSQALPTSWKPNVSSCEWTGIICSGRSQRIVSLNVSSMGLEGTISPLLGNLSFLRVLDLSNNSFHGYIPYQLGSLFRLKKLRLSFNQLQGSIPPTLGGCRSLTNFSMSSNSLTGNIPPELCVLPKLQSIKLGYNNLTGTIPACLGNISALDFLDLKRNNLHGRVPSDLGMLSHLGLINLWKNLLTGQIPSSFSNCTKLRDLYLPDNRLTGHIPEELCSKNTQMMGIYLFVNQLSGSIPASLFNCTKLQTIELGSNQLSGIVPMELGKLKELRFLYLHNNQLVSGSTTNLPIITALTNCSSLEGLVLESNRLKGSLPFSIGHLSTKMDFLYLDENELAGEIPPQIGNLTNLTLIDLERNFFTGAVPSSLKMLQRLQRLYLGSNNLEGNIPAEIGQLNSLGLLDLGGNNLSGRIPDSIGGLWQLVLLDLSHNQLSGNIPAILGKCVKLLQLDLSYNRLNGPIPLEVSGLANLAFFFNLSNNLLQGPLPSELSKMTMVQAIDISANQLTGDIPSTLGSCIALEFLNLSFNSIEGLIPISLSELQNIQDMDFSCNNLSGGIPMSLEKLKMLQHVNFSFNKLSGEVPKGGVFKKLGRTTFMGNAGLCGSWVSLPPCSASKHKIHSHFKRVVILIVAVTAIVLCCLCFGILWRGNLKRQILRIEAGSLEVEHIRRVSHGELLCATNEFSETNLLGVGSFGKVYKGVLNDGTMVAVKLFNMENEGANESFERECNVLSRVRHRNLIKVMTSYSDPNFKALVFPFMLNGSLEKWLYPDDQEDSSGLSLIQRLNIAIDIAQGVAYLHHDCFVQVIHSDLKPNNVLMGEDMTAYLTDFGIATICFPNFDNSTSTSTHTLKGTAGYIPPEYGLGGRVTTKGDVYSYGIVLLEMLIGKKPTHNMFVEGMNLQKWASSGFPDQIWEVVDKNLLRTGMSNSFEEDKEIKCLSRLISVGLLCTKESPVERPNMMDVVRILHSTRDTFLGTAGNPIFQSDISNLLGTTGTTSNNNGQGQSSSTF